MNPTLQHYNAAWGICNAPSPAATYLILFQNLKATEELCGMVRAPREVRWDVGAGEGVIVLRMRTPPIPIPNTLSSSSLH
jgi:hypothetical protein